VKSESAAKKIKMQEFFCRGPIAVAPKFVQGNLCSFDFFNQRNQIGKSGNRL